MFGIIRKRTFRTSEAIEHLELYLIRKNMKVLVTGGAGFIGSNFIRYWLKKYPHDKVINLDALTYAGNLENLKDVENNPNYSFVKGSIGDAEVLSQAMKGVDCVFHEAALRSVPRSIDDPVSTNDVNINGTLNLLMAAKKSGVNKLHPAI